MSAGIRVRNPVTGQFDGELNVPNAETLRRRCDRLKKNQPGWHAHGAEQRADAMLAFAAALTRHRSSIVSCLASDTGRGRIAEMEFDVTLEALERSCADACEIPDELAAETGNARIVAHQQRVPYGLVVHIAPWNFPLLLSLLDVFPALAVGNAAIVKPSEVTPRWVAPVNAALKEVPEVSNVLAFALGNGATGEELIGHADVVTFTGSAATGRRIAKSAAERFVPALLDTGGNDPAIVLSSADLDLATEKILWSATTAGGQARQSLERIYVAEGIAEDFIELLSLSAAGVSLSADDPHDGFLGPFIHARQGETVMEQIEDAVARGARILAGGELVRQGGLWLPATVLGNADHRMRIMREESLGPVMPVMTFATIDEAIALANDSHYGQSASVFGSDAGECRAVARRLNAGAVAINDASLTATLHTVPHDVFGLSGMGRSRFGRDGCLRFLRTKAIFEPAAE